LGPEYDRTKILCRGAARPNAEIDIAAIVVDLRGDELEMNL
jgi:hypothetical protein